MIRSSEVRTFGNRYWSTRDQEMMWRHEAALELVCEEPVLDVGGGDGLFLSLLRERKGFCHATLLDVSPVAVEKARGKGIAARVADITRPLPFNDQSFGTACALDLMEHLFDPLQTLKELARVARWVVVVVPNFHYWKDRLYMLAGRVPFQCSPKRGHVHWFNDPMARRLIADSGMSVDAVRQGGFRRLGPIGPWLARRRPNLFAHSIAFRLFPASSATQGPAESTRSQRRFKSA